MVSVNKTLNVLIADDEEEIREILSFALKSSLNCEIQLSNNGLVALDYLSKFSFDLILCDYSMPIMNGGEVYMHLLSVSPSTKYVMCSTHQPDDYNEFIDRSSFFGNIQKPHLIKGVKAIVENLKTEMLIEETKNVPTYTPIGVRLLFALAEVPSDIFFKLSENKYIKIFNAGDTFDETDLIKFSQSKTDNLFALSAAKDLFLDRIHDKILTISNKNNSSNNADVGLQVHSLLVSTFKGYGIQKAIVPLVETHLSETFDLCKSNKSLSLLLDKLLRSQESYLGKHSFMLAAVSVAIAEKMDWFSDSNAQKLVMAALFHDVFLKEKHFNELIFLASKNSDEDFLTHSQKAADLLGQMPNIPSEVGLIVLEHHEVGEVNGFPSGMPISKTSKLSQLFTFSHYVVDLMLISQRDGVINEDDFYKKLEIISQKSAEYSKFLVLFRTINLFN